MTLHAPDAIGVADRIAERLMVRGHSDIDADAVRQIVLDSMRRYRHLDHPANHARALAAQLARDRIDALLWNGQHGPNERPASFLFVCSGNAGRSQIAAAVMRAIAPAETRTICAGDRPAARIFPAVIDALDEIGVPTFGEYPKPLAPELVTAADHIVLLDCEDSLEQLQGRRTLRWSIPFDSTSGRQAARHMRNHIAEQVRDLALAMGLDPGPL